MLFWFLLWYSLILVMLLCAFVVTRGLSFAVVVIRFTNIKIFHVVIKFISSAGEAPTACQAAQDCTIDFLFWFVICLCVHIM
jgi:hypothetical protein